MKEGARLPRCEKSSTVDLSAVDVSCGAQPVTLLNTTPSLPVSSSGTDPVLLDWLSAASPFTEPLLRDEAGETGVEKQPR